MTEARSNNKKPIIPAYLSWLFPYKRKGLAIDTQSSITYYLFQNKISLILINWIFQGMKSMGTADLIGKVILDAFFFLLCYPLIVYFMDVSRVYHVFIAIISAHTVSWLVNAHFWDVGRFLGITRTSPDRFFPYIRKIMMRVAHNTSIHAAIVIGGVSRNAGFKETSDVDMIFIKEKGLSNTINAVFTAVRERAIAFFCKFPLHLELYDNIEYVNHRDDEVPIVIKDVKGMVMETYANAGKNIASLEDFESQG